jgi:hypothetical protein
MFRVVVRNADPYETDHCLVDISIATAYGEYISLISWLTITEICVTNDNEYVPFIVITIRSFHLQIDFLKDIADELQCPENSTSSTTSSFILCR